MKGVSECIYMGKMIFRKLLKPRWLPIFKVHIMPGSANSEISTKNLLDMLFTKCVCVEWGNEILFGFGIDHRKNME